MAEYYPERGAGPNFVPAYQVSGVPFVTSSLQSGTATPGVLGTTPERIDFPYVTRFFHVQNHGENPLRVGFSLNGVNAKGHGSVSNYFIVPASGSSPRLELRCKSLFLRAEHGKTAYSVLAGLSGVDAGQFPILTGTISGSVRAGPSDVPLFEGVG